MLEAMFEVGRVEESSVGEEVHGYALTCVSEVNSGEQERESMHDFNFGECGFGNKSS